MKYLTDIVNWGIQPDENLETAKSIRFLNLTILCCIFMFIVVLGYNIYFEMPAISYITTSSMITLMFIPLWLNKHHKGVLALYFLLISLVVIVAVLCLLYGLGLHYQYYIIPFVAMSLLFFDKLLGWKKWLITLASIGLWIGIEFYNLHYAAIILLDDSTTSTIKAISEAKILGLIVFIFIVYSKESYRQIKTISVQQDQLLQANKDLEQFAYLVSHDLKAPLKSIYSHVEMIQIKYHKDFDNDLQNMFGFVEEKTRTMDQLVTSILDYSHSGANKGQVVVCNVRELINDVLDNINVPSNVEIELPSNLPILKTNAVQLGQVFTNFIGNAIKYNDKEQGEIRITIKESEPNYLRFEIHDNGMGISEKYLSKVFDVFETAHNTKRSDSTGVGLAIVKKLIKLYNGKVGVESKEGEGSIFWFTWPIKMS